MSVANVINCTQLLDEQCTFVQIISPLIHELVAGLTRSMLLFTFTRWPLDSEWANGFKNSSKSKRCVLPWNLWHLFWQTSFHHCGLLDLVDSSNQIESMSIFSVQLYDIIISTLEQMCCENEMIVLLES